MGTKGANEKSFAFYEELPFRATPNSNNVAIYKRHHLQKKLPLEQRNYFVHIPVENTNGGIRKSLRTINREDAIKKAEDLLLEVKVDIRQGSSIVPVPVEVVWSTDPVIVVFVVSIFDIVLPLVIIVSFSTL